jgi:hypothetical protein
MGDKIGRVHLGKQDLSDLQTRKMKGLKRRAGMESSDEEDEPILSPIESMVTFFLVRASSLGRLPCFMDSF